MSSLVIITALTLLGLCLGSFAGATVWRLRARQLVDDKKAGEEVDKKEYKRLKPLAQGMFGNKNDRSRCLHCGYTLRWYDLIPLVSWVSLRGKCRECRKPIGYFEPLMELGVAAFFVGSYLLWPEALTSPVEITHFILWLIAGTALAIAFAYDAKWFLLPDVITAIAGVAGLSIATISVVTAPDLLVGLINVAASIGVLSGLYLILYLASKGQWVGYGDVKLGLVLGLLLADWRLALIALFAANLVGTLLVLPGLVTGKIKSQAHIPFGPLLIIGTLIAQFWGVPLLEAYGSLLFI